MKISFNTQPPEGGCVTVWREVRRVTVSTHSRPKAAAMAATLTIAASIVSTHSRPKAAAHLTHLCNCGELVSTHSRPKAAAPRFFSFQGNDMFQHTAARRRRRVQGSACAVGRSGFNTQPPEGGCIRLLLFAFFASSFNTQPPEGGCASYLRPATGRWCFNTQPPEGGCRSPARTTEPQEVSTHSRPKAAALAVSISYSPS